MAIIDRYLLRQFLWIFVIFFSSMLGLYIVADSVNNFEELGTYAKTHGGILRVIGEYYGYRAFAFFDQISGLLILVAAMFTMASFKRHNELTALLAAGIPTQRLVRPLIVVAVLFAIFAAINREVLIPSVREHLRFNAQELVRGKVSDLNATYDTRTEILLDGKGVIRRDQRIVEPTFSVPRALSQYGHQFLAEEAVYIGAEDDRPGGYLLNDVKQPKDLDNKPSLRLGDTPIIITPADADWLEPGQCFVVSGLDFDQLAGGDTWRKYSSTPELIQGLSNPSLQRGTQVQVAIHSRMVKPILDVTLLMLGLPLVLSRRIQNMFVAVGAGVLLVTAFMLLVIGCQYLGSNSTVSPALAAWLPVMIFVPMAVGLSEAIRE